MPGPFTPELIDTRRAEREYGISRWVLRTLVDRGQLPVVRPPGIRRSLLRRSDIELAIRSWTERQGG